LRGDAGASERKELHAMVRLLTDDDVQQIIFEYGPLDVMRRSMHVLEQAFEELAHGRVAIHPRTGLDYPTDHGYYTGNFLRILPAMIPAMGTAGVLVWTGYHDQEIKEQGPRKLDFKLGGCPLLLFDYADKMRLYSIIEYYFAFDSIRTAAPVGIGIKWLAPESAGVVGLLGAGGLAHGHLLAACAGRPVKEVKVFSPTQANRDQFCKKMGKFVDADVRPVDSAEEAVRGSNIVVAATNANKPVIDGSWIRPGMHVATSARNEIDERTVHAADRIVVSWTGELLNNFPPREPYATMLREGRLSQSQLHELHDVVIGKVPRRQNNDEITLHVNHALNLSEPAVGSLFYRLAKEKGIGTDIGPMGTRSSFFQVNK
jgi:ornithine cyclodeaminase/alanine dehydrogenase-like protein (mu-crystallin family)